MDDAAGTIAVVDLGGGSCEVAIGTPASRADMGVLARCRRASRDPRVPPGRRVRASASRRRTHGTGSASCSTDSIRLTRTRRSPSAARHERSRRSSGVGSACASSTRSRSESFATACGAATTGLRHHARPHRDAARRDPRPRRDRPPARLEARGRSRWSARGCRAHARSRRVHRSLVLQLTTIRSLLRHASRRATARDCACMSRALDLVTLHHIERGP